jgi:hypothetical protein
MIDPITIGVGALVWMLFKKQSDSQVYFGKMTPERDEVYRNALEYCKVPSRLREYADEFQKFGLKAEAHVLRKRAEWRGRSAEDKARHDEIFNRAMQSVKIEGIEAVAAAFEQMTATIKAAQLRERVKSLQALAEKPAETPEPEKTEARVTNGVNPHPPEQQNGGLSPSSNPAE